MDCTVPDPAKLQQLFRKDIHEFMHLARECRWKDLDPLALFRSSWSLAEVPGKLLLLLVLAISLCFSAVLLLLPLLLKDRQGLMFGVKRDDIVPPKSTEALWEALGKPKIVWYDTSHVGAALYFVSAMQHIVPHFQAP